MSIAQFGNALDNLAPKLDRIETKLDRVSEKVEKTKGPLGDLIAKAEEVGSAVGALGNAMVEVVSLDQTNWHPALQGVVWQLYEVQKAAEETKAVSRDLLDQIVPLIDKHMPNFELWLKKILQMAADGEITFEEMQKKIDDFASSVGATQLNTMYHNDIPGFIIQFRKLMQDLKDGKMPMDEAAASLDEITGKAKGAVQEIRNVTAGMTKGSKGGSLGSSSTDDSSEKSGMSSADAALKKAATKLLGASKR